MFAFGWEFISKLWTTQQHGSQIGFWPISDTLPQGFPAVLGVFHEVEALFRPAVGSYGCETCGFYMLLRPTRFNNVQHGVPAKKKQFMATKSTTALCVIDLFWLGIAGSLSKSGCRVHCQETHQFLFIIFTGSWRETIPQDPYVCYIW